MNAGATRLTPVQLTLLMCIAEALCMTGFATYTTLLPALQPEWGLSNSEAGLISGIFYAGYVAATPILTSLTDRVDARRVYLLACGLSFAGAAGFALFASGLQAWPLIICGVLKILYDIALLWTFRHVKPPEESAA